MYTAYAVLLSNGWEFGFGFERQIDDFVFQRFAFEIFAIVIHGGQYFAGMYGTIDVIAPECFAHQDAQIWFAWEIQDIVYAPRRSAVFAE